MIFAGATSVHPASDFPAAAVAALIAGAFSLAALAITLFLNARREQHARRRDTYSAAFAAVVGYKEFPYVVRRRRAGSPAIAADERVRISEQLRNLQQQLSYHTAWLATESRHVASAYNALVDETRRVAGGEIRRAWLEAPMRSDAGMNMPDLGLGALGPMEAAYLVEAGDHLSVWPRWWRRRRRP